MIKILGPYFAFFVFLSLIIFNWNKENSFLFYISLTAVIVNGIVICIYHTKKPRNHG